MGRRYPSGCRPCRPRGAAAPANRPSGWGTCELPAHPVAIWRGREWFAVAYVFLAYATALAWWLPLALTAPHAHGEPSLAAQAKPGPRVSEAYQRTTLHR